MKITNEYKKQNELDFEFMFPKNKKWFTPKQASKIIGCSDQYIRNGVHSGKILAHVSNNENDLNSDLKSFIRIHKQSLELYLLETANYSKEDFIEKIRDILIQRNEYELMRVENIIKELLYKSQSQRENISTRWV